MHLYRFIAGLPSDPSIPVTLPVPSPFHHPHPTTPPTCTRPPNVLLVAPRRLFVLLSVLSFAYRGTPMLPFFLSPLALLYTPTSSSPFASSEGVLDPPLPLRLYEAHRNPSPDSPFSPTHPAPEHTRVYPLPRRASTRSLIFRTFSVLSFVSSSPLAPLFPTSPTLPSRGTWPQPGSLSRAYPRPGEVGYRPGGRGPNSIDPRRAKATPRHYQ